MREDIKKLRDKFEELLEYEQNRRQDDRNKYPNNNPVLEHNCDGAIRAYKNAIMICETLIGEGEKK